MKFLFEATIYKTGINPCADVPLQITAGMQASKGYIPIKGKINNHSFQQTLVPVRNSSYRLFVNGAMLIGAHVKVGDKVSFIIEQDFVPRTVPMHKKFKKELDSNNLFPVFKKLASTRQNEILKYLNHLKTNEAVVRNIDKVIGAFKKKK